MLQAAAITIGALHARLHEAWAAGPARWWAEERG
jgi:hypothetical protein